MKCQYYGWNGTSWAGCNEDCIGGGKFCHAHRYASKDDEYENVQKRIQRTKVLLVVVIVLMVFVAGICTLLATGSP